MKKLALALLLLAFPRGMEIVAHRGASRDAPENTLAAFRLSWERGADVIEGDFRLTRDGHVVCVHDETTKRVAGVDRRVSESTLADLRELDVGSRKGPGWKGERIPTLQEVLAIVPEGKRILIEIKCGPEILKPLKEALEGSDLEPDQTTIIAFSERVMGESKKALPDRKTLWLTDFEKDERTGAWKPSVDEAIATMRAMRADGLDCRAHESVDEEFVRKIRKAGFEIHVWTVNDAATAKRFRDLGVDSLTTDRPRWMRDQLSERKAPDTDSRTKRAMAVE